MEARALAELPVVRLQRLGGLRIFDELVDAGADLLHLLEVRELHRRREALGGHLAARALLQQDQQLPDDVGPAVHHEVLGLEAAGDQRVEVVHAALLPAGLEARRPLRIGRTVRAHVDRRRRALEHVQVLGSLAEVRDALHGGRAGADDADALVLQPREVAVAVAAGVAVVPAAGVERVALEVGRCRGCPAASAGAADRSPCTRSGRGCGRRGWCSRSSESWARPSAAR